MSYLGNRPTVAVGLEIILINYYYLFPPKEKGGEVYKDMGTLRICSDLDGVTQIYRNGSGGAFADESEVSEFLLKPLLEFVDG